MQNYRELQQQQWDRHLECTGWTRMESTSPLGRALYIPPYNPNAINDFSLFTISDNLFAAPNDDERKGIFDDEELDAMARKIVDAFNFKKCSNALVE